MKHIIVEYGLSGIQAINWGIANEKQEKKAFDTATKVAVRKTDLFGISLFAWLTKVLPIVRDTF